MSNFSCDVSTFPNATVLGVTGQGVCDAAVSYAVAEECCTTSTVMNVTDTGAADGCIRACTNITDGGTAFTQCLELQGVIAPQLYTCYAAAKSSSSATTSGAQKRYGKGEGAVARYMVGIVTTVVLAVALVA